MLYNIIINSPRGGTQSALAINGDELNKFVNAFAKAKEVVLLNGETIYLQGVDFVKIYDVSRKISPDSVTYVQKEIRKWAKMMNKGSIDETVLSEYGENLTSEFIIHEWGAYSSSSEKIEKQESSINSGLKKVFISHSSHDKLLVSKFIDHILILGFGIDRESIFCTSVEGNHIKSGKDFKNEIYYELKNAALVLQFITKNYKSSEICLNEMGAAWIITDKVIPLVADPFNYDVGFIHSNIQQLRLNNEDDLVKLHDDFKNSVFSKNISTSNLLVQVRNFLSFIHNYTLDAELKALDNHVYFYEETNTISGILKAGIFGHPIMAIFEESTSFHRYYVLELENAIDILPNTLLNEDYTHAEFKINRIQIVPPENFNEEKLKSLLNRKIRLTGNFFCGFTQWHQTKVLMNFTKIEAI